jgi:hypothetical protein
MRLVEAEAARPALSLGGAIFDGDAAKVSLGMHHYVRNRRPGEDYATFWKRVGDEASPHVGQFFAMTMDEFNQIKKELEPEI